ncbi:MAG: methylaspartate mutase, S subunit [halophilic archaeon J07HX5]|nr:MAG: methylaspartate mutase, S subunit [halophilic archaeon J07HX5]
MQSSTPLLSIGKGVTDKQMSSPSVVVGTIGSDAHVVGITLLEHALREAGFEVRNLGAQTPKKAFAEAAAEIDASAVLVSSLYGHAEQDCAGLHEELAARDVAPTTYIGGNLAVGQSEFEEVRRRFREMGFDDVFDADTDFEDVVTALRAEFGMDERTTQVAQARS